MNLNCEICAQPAETVTLDKQYVICSLACYDKLDASLQEQERLCGAKEKDERILTVKGRGEVKVTPDRVRITLEVQQKAPTVSEVNQLLIANAQKLIDLLKNKTEGRAQKLQTDDLTIEPVYKPESHEEVLHRQQYNTERTITSYEGTFPISFEAAIDDAGPLIDLALKDDYASSVEGLRYIVSDAIGKPAFTEALRLATADAEGQAQVVLDALKLKKKAVVRVSINDQGHSMNRMQQESSVSYASFKQKRALANTQLIAPESEISATVTIELSYE